MVKGLPIVLVLLKIIVSKAGQQENDGLNQNPIITTSPLVTIKKCCPNGQTYDKWYNCVDLEGRKTNILYSFFTHEVQKGV